MGRMLKVCVCQENIMDDNTIAEGFEAVPKRKETSFDISLVQVQDEEVVREYILV